MVQQEGTGGGGGRRINVDVDRATVARADVTRMTVGGGAKDTADDLLAEIKGEGAGSIKAYLEQIRNAVEDCCVGGAKGAAGSKSLEKSVDDLAKALGDTKEVQDLDKTLSKLNKNIEVLITTTASGGAGAGGEGGGGGGAGGPDLARVRATEKQIEIVGNAFIKFERKMDDSGRSVLKLKTGWEDSTTGANTFTKAMLRMANDTIATEAANAFNSLIETVQETVADMSDLRSSFRKTIQVFTDSMEVSATGMTSTMSMFTDDWDQLVQGLTGDFDDLADSMRNTVETIKMAREAEGTEMGAVLLDQAASLDELGQYMKDSRTALFEGNKLRGMMDDGAANAAVIEMLGIQKRAGTLEEMNAAQLGRQAGVRAQYLASIAMNTGLTVEQLLEQNKEEQKNLQALLNLGAISQKQFDNLTLVSKTMGPGMKDILEKAAGAGFDFTTMMAQNPELRKALAATQATGSFRELIDKIGPLSDKLSPEEFEKALKDAAKPLGKDLAAAINPDDLWRVQRQLGNQMVNQLGLLTGEINASTLQLGDQGDKELTALDILLRDMKSWFSNMFPGGTTGLALAIGVNTLALIANTLAHSGLGGLLKSVGGKLIGSIGKVGGMLAGVVGKLAPIIGTAGVIVAKLAAAFAAGYAIGTLLNKLYEKISTLLGGTGSVASDVTDFVDNVRGAAGLETEAERLGIQGPKSYNEMTVSEKWDRYGPSVMDAIPGLGMLSMASRTAKIGRDMRANVTAGPSAPAIPGAPSITVAGGGGAEMGGVEGRLDRVAAAVEEGNRHARETAANTKQRGGTPSKGGNVAFVASGSP